MKAGAVDFIQKPFRDQDLLDRIHQALQIARRSHDERLETTSVQRKFDTLTPRENEVMEKVVAGCANKVIAIDLGVSQRTVELHRARVMQKMGVRSVADLVRLAERLRDESE
jgi:FixJ family two-component response regulator